MVVSKKRVNHLVHGLSPFPYFFLKCHFFCRQFILFWYGSARRKNAIFWSNFSKKCPKTPFWPVFSKFCLRLKTFDQKRSFWCFGRARKIKLIDLKKSSTRFSKFFWKSAPPHLEKILDPPLDLGNMIKVWDHSLTKLSKKGKKVYQN